MTNAQWAEMIPTRLKSMLDLSLPTANALFGLSNIALILGGVLVLIGTVGVFWTTGIRDRYADERISNNEARAALANEGAAKANERASALAKEAEHERLERLKLEAEIAPRRLTREQHEAIATALSRFAGRSITVTSYSQDAESAVLTKQVIEALQTAGLKVADGTASLMQMGGFSMGIHVAGPNRDLVTTLRESLSQTAHLAVAPESPTQLVPHPAGIVSGPPNPAATDASILVGIKPPTR
jgi:hypothetical protein